MNCLAKQCFNLQHQTDHDINCAPQSVSMSQICENNAVVQDFSVNNTESWTEKEILCMRDFWSANSINSCKMRWDDLEHQNIAVFSSEHQEKVKQEIKM